MSSSTTNAPPSSGFLPQWIKDRVDQYIFIGWLVKFAGSFYLQTLWSELRRGHLGVLFGHGNHEAREESFAEFYKTVSNDFAKHEQQDTPVPALVASAHGTVLELGPGSGNQLSRFDAAKITHVYGVEPNLAFTQMLTDRLRETKLGQDGKYTLIPCGLEDEQTLARFGIVDGSVDCVVSMQVMCSLPNLNDHVKHMHRLLKPGGELIFWEHGLNERDFVSRCTQRLWCLIWPRVIGGCRLDRVTRDALLQAGDWEVVDILAEMESHRLMPRLSGRLVKSRQA